MAEVREHSQLPPTLGLKLISIFTAVILWAFVSLQKETEVAFTLPVQFANVPSGLTVADTPPDVVVTLKGTRYDIMLMRREDVKARLDLSGVREGSVAFPALEEQVQHPAGVRVVRITPARIILNIRSNGAR